MTAPASSNSAFQKFGKFQACRYRAGSDLPAYRTIVDWPRSVWWKLLECRFNELVSLPLGWDGYSGQPVSFTCAKFAANLLEKIYKEGISPPSLVPGSDGTLQIEWHKNQFDIEIDVLGANNVVATRYDHLTDKEDVVELQTDFKQLVVWIEELASKRDVLDSATA